MAYMYCCGGDERPLRQKGILSFLNLGVRKLLHGIFEQNIEAAKADEADVNEAHVKKADEADVNEAHVNKADEADVNEADLNEADLNEADLNEAVVNEADANKANATVAKPG